MSSSRQLAAIMFTDIVGYTALMGKDEEKALEILKQNRQIHRPLIDHHHGRLLKEMGDGILSSFHTVSDAVFCALDIQEACIKSGEFQLRIGIHQGEVVFEKNDVLGDGVNIASRLQSIAAPAEILISESVYGNIANKKGLQVEFLREETLKNVSAPLKIYRLNKGNIPEPTPSGVWHQHATGGKPVLAGKKKIVLLIAIVGVLLATGFILFFNGFNKKKLSLETAPNDAEIRSIVVLPFKNNSSDKDRDHLGSGIAEEIRNVLKYMVKDLKVIGSTSSFYYKDSALRTIGERLKVRSILEGSVRQLGKQLHVTVSLINANDESIIWSQPFIMDLKDIRKIQDDVAAEVCRELKLNFFNDSQGAGSISVNPEAYEMLLKGNVFYDRGDFSRAIEFFGKANEIDSSYAYPYIRKGWATYQHTLSNNLPSKEGFSNAKMFLERGMKMNLAASERKSAHHALAYLNLWQFDWKNALKEYDEGRKTDTKPSTFHAYYQSFINKKTEDAINIMKEVVAVNPVDVLNLRDLAIHQYLGRQYDEVRTTCSKMIELDSSFGEAYRISGMVFLAEKKFESAMDEFRKAGDLKNPYAQLLTIITLPYIGKKQLAADMFRVVDTLKSVYVRPATKALIQFSLGNSDKAFEWLNRAFDEKDFLLAFLRVDPLWDPFRSDPRFKRLMKKLDFPE